MSQRLDNTGKSVSPIRRKLFDWKSGFSHLRTSHPSKRKFYKCNTCNKSFPKASSLSIHRRLHSTNTNIDNNQKDTDLKKKKISEIYKNLITETLYSSDSDCEYELLQTVIKVSGVRNCTYLCEYCDKKFMNNKNLTRHTQNKHSNNISDDTEMHSNNTDNMQIDDKDLITESMLVDKEALEDTMQIDNLSTDNMDSDNQEIITIKTAPSDADIPDKKYNCTYCNATFKLLLDLVTHRKSHFKQSITKRYGQTISDSSRKRRYRCHLCRSSYSQKIYFENHMRLHQNGKLYEMFEDPTEDKYLCTYCGKQFSASSHLSVHVKLHIGDKKYLCSFCGKAFTLERYLMNHQKIHTQEKLFSCEYCHKRFIYKATLVEHLRIHAGIKPHECTICNKKFTHYSGLTQHLQIHTDEKKYICNVCGKGFRFGGHYRGHMRTHTGDRPFACTICDKRFALSGSLVVHYRTHSGEKPYRCKICTKGFIKSCNLKQHLKTHILCKEKEERLNTNTDANDGNECI